jgi:transposase-like protein
MRRLTQINAGLLRRNSTPVSMSTHDVNEIGVFDDSRQRHEYSFAEEARKLDLRESLLRRGKAQLASEGEQAFRGQSVPLVEDESVRLRTDNKRLAMERDLLKSDYLFFVGKSKTPVVARWSAGKLKHVSRADRFGSVLPVSGRRWHGLPCERFGESLACRVRPRLRNADRDAGGPLQQVAQYADFHSLRHSYLTLGVRAGIDLRTAQELAGHSTPLLTAGCTISPGPLRMTGTDGDFGRSAGRCNRGHRVASNCTEVHFGHL